MPQDFVSHVFDVYFLHELLVYMYLSTCISSGYHVMLEPRFLSDVYSTWVFSRGSFVYISMRITVLHVILFPCINGEPGTSLGQHWFNVVCLLVRT